MKIRWTKNSVRFRITPSEFAAVERGENVGETLLLPGGASWRAAIEAGKGETSLFFSDGELRFSLSEADRELLAQPQREGVYFQQSGETELRYFIEKDFPCAHPRAAEALEEPTETFAPPPGFEERKNG
jgi:hypothetical protein